MRLRVKVESPQIWKHLRTSKSSNNYIIRSLDGLGHGQECQVKGLVDIGEGCRPTREGLDQYSRLELEGELLLQVMEPQQ